MFLNRANEGAFGDRADHGHDAFTFVEEHEGGYVSDLELCHRLGVLVRAQLQNLELAPSSSVFSDNLIYDGAYHATWTAPTAPNSTAQISTEQQSIAP